MTNPRVLLFGIALLLSQSLHAAAYPPFSASLAAGADCTVPLDALHPTQFNVGTIEVGLRAKHLAKMDADKLAKYKEAHILPIVIGPGGVPFITDHHHFAAAMERAGFTDAIGHIVKNFATLDPADFWKRMESAGWVYLYDKGAGPKDVSALPAHIADMTDDPYRSVAWAVRHRGGYGDSTVPFADFHWADFFRSRVKIGPGAAGFDQAVNDALKLALSPAAKDLPGYGLKPAKDEGN